MFPTENSVFKILYLASLSITKKWTMPIKDWGEAISHSKGGALRAQLEDANGVIIEWELGTEITLPNFSFPAAAAIGGNDFLLLW